MWAEGATDVLEFIRKILTAVVHPISRNANTHVVAYFLDPGVPFPWYQGGIEAGHDTVIHTMESEKSVQAARIRSHRSRSVHPKDCHRGPLRRVRKCPLLTQPHIWARHLRSSIA